MRTRALLPASLLLTACFCLCPAVWAGGTTQPPVITGYVFPRNALLDSAQIPARKLTRINYAFASIENGLLVNSYPSDDRNLAALVALKRQNPSLAVLVSVGGWFGSSAFSDMALTPQSRAAFIASTCAYIKQHRLDGLNIDWEYPGTAGATNHFRPEDGHNFTLLLEGTRAAFNRLEAKLHRRLYLTIAAGASSGYLAHTEMDQAQHYVDAVDLMAYDDYEPSADRTTGNAAPLFTDPADPKQLSADRSVREFELAGVPAAKIVLGVPFYGHAWRNVPGANHGLFQPGKPAAQPDVSYGDGPAALLKSGYTRYWDRSAAAASLYSPAQKTFISYEDPQSLAAKCNYVREHKLGGVMFWDLEDDPAGALLDAIDHSINLPADDTVSNAGPASSR